MSAGGTPILIYDGDCPFCTASVARIASSWQRPVRAVASQRLSDAELGELGLTTSDVCSAAWWIDESGRRRRGHLAVAYALAHGAGWRALCGRILLAPPGCWVGAALYSAVVRRRLLPGGPESSHP